MSSIRGEDRPAEAGSVLLLAVVFVAALSVLSLSLLGWAASGSRRAAVEIARAQALYLAESGVSDALHQLNSGTLDVPAPGGEKEFSSGASLDWALGSYQVVVSRAGNDEARRLLVRATGRAGVAARLVTVEAGQQPLVPGSVFSAGPKRDGVIATDPADPRYGPDFSPPPIDFEMPALPSPVSQWDYRTSLSAGTHVFDRIDVKNNESLLIQADGPVGVYVKGYVRLGEKATLQCVGPGQVRFYVYGDPADSDGWVLSVGKVGKVHSEGPSAWTIDGPTLLGKDALWTQESADAPVTLNIRGRLVADRKAVLGSQPADDQAPRVLVVLAPGNSTEVLELGDKTACVAMVYAPDVDVTMGKDSHLQGALVCHSLTQEKQAACEWNPAIAELGGGLPWEPLAGWWQVTAGTWCAP
ncbi:MAG: hypothetical protein QME70_11395 [Bacillota bacterium]|nr:hypothetical protein [Bacillota bacterium]